MVIGVARAGIISGGLPTFAFNISSTAANQNLRTLANAAGYTGVGNVKATIVSGVEIYSTTASTASLVTGSFPSGVTVTLINQGTVSGAGGAGGAGNSLGSGTVFLLPYYMGLYHGYIAKP